MVLAGADARWQVRRNKLPVANSGRAETNPPVVSTIQGTIRILQK